MFSGSPLDVPAGGAAEHCRPWYLVLWLTGVDCFSIFGAVADDPHYRVDLEHKIQNYFKLHEPTAFLYVGLMDNRSEFYSCLRVKVTREGEDYLVEASGAVAIANTIAFLADELNPVSVILGLTQRNVMRQALAFVLLGRG